jgi:site-specific DNA recombinase
MAKAKQDRPSQTRAVGYCRTSGEGQRDNTSIPRQREAIAEFCKRMGWELVHVYVDECKTGSKIEGRDDFKRLLKDAANGRFDLVVVYDITRFARDGFDIIDNARFLKANHSIHVVDTKLQFDNRSHRNSLQNFLHAGVSEHERLSIMERTIGGRIAKAQQGLPWGSLPLGREYTGGKWVVNDKGQAVAEIMRRFLKGELLAALCREYGVSSPNRVYKWVNDQQIAGVYVARIKCDELGYDVAIPMPMIPALVSDATLKRVKQRLAHNRRHNQRGERRHLLSGFVRCNTCNRVLEAQAQQGRWVYYRHAAGERCSFKSIRADVAEAAVLDYLFRFVVDEPALIESAKRAMPSSEDRQALERELADSERRLTHVEKQIANLVNAIANGADVALLLTKQLELKAERETLSQRTAELADELTDMPDETLVQRQASVMRIRLLEQLKQRDWRELDYDEVRRFLRFLFGDDTRSTGQGVFVDRVDGDWVYTFRGAVEISAEVVNARPVSRWRKIENELQNEELRRIANIDRSARYLTREAI